VRLFIDEHVYPVSRYGIEKLVPRKIPVHTFRHLDAAHLVQLVKKHCTDSRIPVIITDGWCPVCGRMAPLQQYARIAASGKGWVIVDDTQAFGILGSGKSNALPYGKDGGGSLASLSLQHKAIVTIVSLAKGFGVPMSVLSGPHNFVTAFAAHSETRVNSSPVSYAHLQAALNGFRIDQIAGNERRARLWKHVHLLRSMLAGAGIGLAGGIFPVQSIRCQSPKQTAGLYEALKKKRIRTVLTVPHGSKQPVLTMLLRSDHTPNAIRVLAENIKDYHLSLKANRYVNNVTGNTHRTGSAKTSTGLLLRS
jgi:8-amino-7-oxononanoate synthase